MVRTTPGLDLLASRLHKLLKPLPTFLAISLLRYACHSLNPSFKDVATDLATSHIVHFSLRVLVKCFHSIRAAKMHASLPIHQSRVPIEDDNFRTLLLSDESFELSNGSISMWNDFVVTSYPVHVRFILDTCRQNFAESTRAFALTELWWIDTSVQFNSLYQEIIRPFYLKHRIRHLQILDRYAREYVFQMKSHNSACVSDNLHNYACRLPSTLLGTVDKIDSPCGSFHVDLLQTAFSMEDLLLSRFTRGSAWPTFEAFVNAYDEETFMFKAQLCDSLESAALRRRMREPTAESPLRQPSLIDYLAETFLEPQGRANELCVSLLTIEDRIYLICKAIRKFLDANRRLFKRLRTELSTASFVDLLDEDSKISNCLRAVIYEALRLEPVVPYECHEAISTTTLPSTHQDESLSYIPGGSKIICDIHDLQRSVDIWGADAHYFDPDRFLDQRKERIESDPYAFMPFGSQSSPAERELEVDAAAVFLIAYIQYPIPSFLYI